jgi:hypothetical protein
MALFATLPHMYIATIPSPSLIDGIGRTMELDLLGLHLGKALSSGCVVLGFRPEFTDEDAIGFPRLLA